MITTLTVCMFDKVFATFSLLTCKYSHTHCHTHKKCTSIDTHNLEVDTYSVKRKTHVN